MMRSPCRFGWLVMVCLLAAGAVALGDNATDQGPTYKRMPWHLVDVWWDLGEDRPFESYSIDVIIHDDVDPESRLYIAPIGLGYLSKTKFYGGIQTQSDGYTRENPRLRKIGPGLLMSMWGERSPDAIRPGTGGLWQSSGHEGDFVSVRRPYAWTKGRYTYRITRMDRQVVEGKPYTWVGAFVYSHERDENVFIGALRFPGENLVLGRRIASFLEIYGRAVPVEQIPKVRVLFGELRVGGELVANPGAVAIYPDGVPDYADSVARDGWLDATLGSPVQRTERRVRLLPARPSVDSP